MTNIGKIIVAVVGLVLLGVGFLIGRSSLPELAFGAIGTNPVENYIPIIKYNEGYYSELPIQTTSTITSVGSTNTGDATISGGTLTVTTSNTATSTITGGCFQFYATSTATAHKFQASTTPGIMYSQYGTCPNL